MFAINKRPNSVYTRNEFQKALEREKSRAERYGSEFCCLLFENSTERVSGRINRQLVNAISNRVRLVDQIGWVNPKGIGVLLAGADSDDGQKVATDIVGRFSLNTKPSFSIYPKSSINLAGNAVS